MTNVIDNIRLLEPRFRRTWTVKEIDLVSLRLFATAVQEGTLARTAERENVAISAISRRISDLELRSGVKLLERHDRGVRATAAGEIMLRNVRHILDGLEQMILDIEAVRGGLGGQVRLHAHMSAASGLLPALMADFISNHPAIDVRLEERTSLDVLSDIRCGEADLGLVSGTVDGGDLHLIPWMHDELVAIVRAGHPLAARQTLSLADMLSEPFVGMQRDSALQTLYRHQAAVLGRRLEERAHATSFESVRKMVSVGLGVSILPAIAAYPFISELGIVARPLRETWARRPLMLCVRDQSKISGATRRLVEYLLERRPLIESSPRFSVGAE